MLDADLSCWLPAENKQLETGLFSSSAEGTRHYCHCEEMAEGQLLPREVGAPQGTVRGALRADCGLLPEPLSGHRPRGCRRPQRPCLCMGVCPRHHRSPSASATWQDRSGQPSCRRVRTDGTAWLQLACSLHGGPGVRGLSQRAG